MPFFAASDRVKRRIAIRSVAYSLAENTAYGIYFASRCRIFPENLIVLYVRYIFSRYQIPPIRRYTHRPASFSCEVRDRSTAPSSRPNGALRGIAQAGARNAFVESFNSNFRDECLNQPSSTLARSARNDRGMASRLHSPATARQPRRLTPTEFAALKVKRTTQPEEGEPTADATYNWRNWGAGVRRRTLLHSNQQCTCGRATSFMA